MPDPADLHMHEDGGQVAVMAGNRVLSCYPAADAGMRNMTVVMLTQLGFAGKDVAAVMGLTPVYVSMLRSRARGQGPAGLVRDRGRPAKLSRAQLAARGGRGSRVSPTLRSGAARGARHHHRPGARPGSTRRSRGG